MTDPRDILPFLSCVPSGPPRPLGALLPAIVLGEATSPWSPKPASPAPVIDVSAIEAEARAAGRAEGLRETAALRSQLAVLVGQLEAAQAAFARPATGMIADAAVAVVEAWAGSTQRAAMFAPIVGDWMARCKGPSKVNVHPSDVEAMRGAIGELPIEITADATVRAGDVTLRGASLELIHAWQPRLAELRDAIAAAIEESVKP